MSMKDPQFRDAMEDNRRREEYDREEAARKRKMASERPICEQPICERCGGKKVVESGPKGKFSGWIPCPDCPAPAATTPERDAVDDVQGTIERINALSDEPRALYVTDWRYSTGSTCTGLITTELKRLVAALAPRDEPAAATDGETMCITIEKFPRCHWHSDCPDRPGSGVLRIVCDDTVSKTTLFECQNCGKRGYLPYGAPFDVPQKVAVESSARRADPPPAVVRRIEEACPFCREPITTERGYVVVQNEDTKEPESCCLLCWTDMKDGAMEAELGREG
jgi:hypothetical protein